MINSARLSLSESEDKKTEKARPLDKIIGVSLLGAMALGLAGGTHAVFEHISKENALNQKADEQMKKDLFSSGTKLSLKGGKIVTLQNITPTKRQLASAQENIGATGNPDVSRPFTKHSSTTHSSSLGFLGPKGISPVPVGVPLSINSESRVDSIQIKRHPSDDEIEQLSELFVASTEPVENVGAELILDTDGPDTILLKVYYGEGSPESVDLMLIAGNEK